MSFSPPTPDNPEPSPAKVVAVQTPVTITPATLVSNAGESTSPDKLPSKVVTVIIPELTVIASTSIEGVPDNPVALPVTLPLTAPLKVVAVITPA